MTGSDLTSAGAGAGARIPAGGAPAALELGPERTCDDGTRERRFDLDVEGRSVPGLLWRPSGDGPWPLVLLGHGGSGSKRERHIVGLARRLAREHRMASAAIDGPVHGERRADPDALPALVLAQFAQVWANYGDAMTDRMVSDWQMTLDSLLQLADFAKGPVGWWGVSMGTIVGLPLVAAEPRIGAAVLGLMGRTGPTRARIERDATAVRCPVLFLAQWDDAMFPHDTALALWESLGTPDKRLHVHTGDHGAMPQEAFSASARFLAERLGGTVLG